MKILARLALVSAILVAVGSCKNEGSDDKDTDETTTSPVSNGSEEEEVALNSAGTVVVTNVATVQAGMIPSSLQTDLGLTLTEAGGPCANTDGFFDCQPNLIKVYIGIAKMFVGVMATVLADINTKLLPHINIPDDSVETCGFVEAAAAEDITKVDYCVTSAAKYRVLAHTEGGPFLYLKVDGDTYEVKVDRENAPDADDGDGPKSVQATVTYTDDTNYTVRVEGSDGTCDDDDVRAPANFIVDISRVSGVWQGKSMLYHPRWAYADEDGVTCATEPTSEMSLGFFTDFVGGEDKATASVYFMPGAVSDAATVTDYPLNDFCTNFSGLCDGSDHSFGDPNPITTSYPNPFCVDSDTTTWGTACTSDVTEIATPTYSSADLWVAPADVGALTMEMPTELAADE